MADYTPGISERRSGNDRFLSSDLSNTDVQTLAAGGASSKRTYDAFGKVASVTGTWSGPSGYGGAYGYQEDGNGLTLLGNRWYDAEVGRFLTRDPAKDGRNWYAYCDNAPVSMVDPSGLQGQGPGIIIAPWPIFPGIAIDPIEFGKWFAGRFKRRSSPAPQPVIVSPDGRPDITVPPGGSSGPWPYDVPVTGPDDGRVREPVDPTDPKSPVIIRVPKDKPKKTTPVPVKNPKKYETEPVDPGWIC